jgi:hypothetical protein
VSLDQSGMNRDELLANVPHSISHWRLLIDHSGITQHVLRHRYPGSGTEEDPYRVSWVADDPRNPMRFSTFRKIFMTSVVGFATLVVSFTSSAYVGSIARVEEYFDINNEVATLGLSLFVLGFALGPLLWVNHIVPSLHYKADCSAGPS